MRVVGLISQCDYTSAIIRLSEFPESLFLIGQTVVRPQAAVVFAAVVTYTEITKLGTI